MVKKSSSLSVVPLVFLLAFLLVGGLEAANEMKICYGSVVVKANCVIDKICTAACVEKYGQTAFGHCEDIRYCVCYYLC
ncbi:unnamed protein product [Linum tenue]|uniref:Uncharacterized protein n=1 Tax=Linum tenue TaxID=586396 RepID=A0AAV0PYN0_9ROSI|nr:unnamed protein product [Linum tenue]